MTAPTATRTPPPEVDGLTATQVAALIALVEAQAKLRRALTQAAVAAALAPFKALAVADWWNPAKVDKAVAAAVKAVRPRQTRAARITDAYLARAGTIMVGKTVAAAGAVDVTKLRRDMPAQVARSLVDGGLKPGYVVLGDTDDGAADTIDGALRTVVPDPGLTAAQRRRAGQATAAETVDPSEPYQRPADNYRLQVAAQGATQAKARANALVYIAEAAETDITLAVREQYRKSLQKIPGVTRYRRILRPELTESGPCGLCVVAADRLYKTEDLHPIHARCACEVLPVLGELDPGLNLNGSDLEALYRAAGSTGGGKRHKGALKKVRVALVEHGELGPVLVDADQHFRGPAEVAKTKHPDKAVRDRAKLDAFEDRLAVLLRRRANGESGLDAAIAWQSERIDQLHQGPSGPAPGSTRAARVTAAA
jgi:hypothetical protein